MGDAFKEPMDNEEIVREYLHEVIDDARVVNAIMDLLINKK